MKRVFLVLLILALLAGGTLAEGYNSFLDDKTNAGFFDQLAWDGLYAYWLHMPDDGSWADPPANLYRMIPGGMEAELLLEGRKDLYIYDVLNLGDGLLLSVAETGGGNTRPALLNYDGSGYKLLPGNIGSVVMGEGVLYNSADGSIYEIPLDTMKPKAIYKYPKDILADIPRITQCADEKLYFATDAYDWYELDLKSKKARKFLRMRGNGFAMDGMFYISDYDTVDGTWKYDISTGNRVKICDAVYDFEQGYGSFVRATGDDPESWFQGAVFDFSKLEGDLKAAQVAMCGENYDYIINDKLLHYDWQHNRMYWSNVVIPGLDG